MQIAAAPRHRTVPALSPRCHEAAPRSGDRLQRGNANVNTIVRPTGLPEAAAPSRPRLDHKTGKGTWAVFALLLLAGLGYTAWSICTDYAGSGETATTVWPFILLGLALLIALGFEFVNGFHDTANAVATVIYTHTLEPHMAVGDGPASGTLSAGRRPAAPRPSASFSRRPASCFWTAEPAPAFPR